MQQLMIRKLVLGSLLSLLLALGFAVPLARAHALLVRSTPAAGTELAILPPSIELWFSEPLEASFSTVYLVDGAGNEFGRGTSSVDPEDPFHMSLPLSELSPGFYTVVWETLSQADGHNWVGSFPLTLLNPDGTQPAGTATFVSEDAQAGEIPRPLAIVSRWLGLLGVMLVFGVLFLWVQIPAAGRSTARMTQPDHQGFRAVAQDNMVVLLFAGLIGVVLGGWLHWLYQLLGLADPLALTDLIFGTRSGNLVLLRQLLAAVIGLAAAVAFLPNRQSPRGRALLSLAILYTIATVSAVGWLVMQRSEPITALVAGLSLAGLFATLYLWRQDRSTPLWPALQRLMTWLLLGLGALMLATFSFGSHAAAASVGSAWAIIGDLLHLVAAAIWLGGLLLLASILWQLRRATTADISLRLLVARFSAIATMAIFVLTLTGIFSSFVQMRSFAQLWSTTYGWMLLAKLALVGVTLLIALLNHRFVNQAASNWTASAAQPFMRRVWTEALVSLGLMLVVAILVQTPVPLPPTTQSAALTLFQDIIAADDLMVHVQSSPNQPGNNVYQVHLYHQDGSPVGEVQLVRLFFEHQTEELGQSSLDLEAQGNDIFSASGAYQNRSGPWNVSVYVRRRGLDDALVEMTINVNQPGAVTTGGAWQTPIPAWPPDAPLTGLAVAIIVGVAIWRQMARRLPKDSG